MSAIDRNELDGYEALVSELRATAPVAPDRLRERVLEGAPAPRRRRSRRRKLALVVVPVAVALAVGAAFIHGFVNSGSQTAELRLSPALTQNGVISGTHGSGSVEGSAHAAVAQSKRARSYAPVAPAAGRGLVRIPKNRLVHAVASLEVRVKSRSDLSAKTNEASQIVGSFGGYAQSVQYQNSRNGYGQADLQLRVPVEKAEAAIARLSTLGVLVSQQVSTQDLQAKVTRQTSAIGSLRRAIAVYESALQSTTLPASQRAILQIRLNNARHQLTQLRHAHQRTVAAGATANISLLLTTRNHAVVAPGNHGSGRVGRLLGSAAHFLALEGIIVLYALIVLAPVLLIGGLAWWILRERRRREERLLASA